MQKSVFRKIVPERMQQLRSCVWLLPWLFPRAWEDVVVVGGGSGMQSELL